MNKRPNDYSLLLSLPFKFEEITEIVRYANGAFAKDIIDNCSEEALLDYP